MGNKYKEMFKNLKWAAELAADAYTGKFDCLEQQIKPLAKTHDDSGLDMYLFGHHSEPGHTVVFRGTSDERDFLTDAQFLPEYCDQLGLWVHGGFKSQFEAAQEWLKHWFSAYSANDMVRFVGHSLGSALAQMCALAHFRSGNLASVRVLACPFWIYKKGGYDNVLSSIEDGHGALSVEMGEDPICHIPTALPVVAPNGWAKLPATTVYLQANAPGFLINPTDEERQMDEGAIPNNIGNHSMTVYKQRIEEILALF